MRSRKRLAGVAAVVALSIGTVGAQQKAASGWTDYLGGPDSSHYSPLTQMMPANVGELDVVWIFPPNAHPASSVINASGDQRHR